MYYLKDNIEVWGINPVDKGVKMSKVENHLWNLVIFLSFVLGLWGSLAIIKIIHNWSQYV